MVFPGDPPPPDYFSPGPIGPGSPGPGPALGGPYQPNAPSSGSSWKPILIGCLIVIALGLVVTVASCGYLAGNSRKAMAGLLKMIEPEYTKSLSPDHTPEQRQEFTDAYEFMASECERLGIIEWAAKYSDAMDQLGRLEADKTITVEESQAWVALVRGGGSGPSNEPGEGGSGEQPSDSGGDGGTGEGGGR
jgi:hypothetical protein